MENRLHLETSPYLLQHKDNPVWWQPWGQESFARARQENKPVFISIGYSTCHWCHVMAHESFEAKEIADILNDNFIAIKIDREERPEVDEIYMNSVLALLGSGGWPLSVWTTPEGKPFYGGTYFPKARFAQVLTKISEVWRDDASKVIEDSNKLFEFTKENLKTLTSNVPFSGLKTHMLAFGEAFREVYDPENGGFAGAPKFPQSMSLRMLMRLGGEQNQAMVVKTLGHMARGGMYDHLAGGFHRYSVDANWHVPHFEKMLYDQALLASTYLDAFLAYKDDEFKLIASETLDYVLREMQNPSGGYYSAQDADSFDPASNHKEEGYFATFTYQELEANLNSEELARLKAVCGVSFEGQLEGKNVIRFIGSDSLVLLRKDPVLARAFKSLRKLRAERPAPDTDRKILTDWNGWMISAMIQGSEVLGEPRYWWSAERALKFLQDTHWPSSGLLRTLSREPIKAVSTDYAALIAAFLDAYEYSGEREYLESAMKLQHELDESFWDKDEGGYFRDNGKDPTLILRPKDVYDGVQPSSNSQSALNLLRLYHLTFDERFKQKAEAIFQVYSEKLENNPLGLSQMWIAVDFYFAKVKEIAIAGSRSEESVKTFLKLLRQTFFPWKVVGSSLEGKKQTNSSEPVKFFICEEGVCSNPTTNPEAAHANVTG